MTHSLVSLPWLWTPTRAPGKGTPSASTCTAQRSGGTSSSTSGSGLPWPSKRVLRRAPRPSGARAARNTVPSPSQSSMGTAKPPSPPVSVEAMTPAPASAVTRTPTSGAPVTASTTTPPHDSRRRMDRMISPLEGTVRVR